MPKKEEPKPVYEEVVQLIEEYNEAIQGLAKEIEDSPERFYVLAKYVETLKFKLDTLIQMLLNLEKLVISAGFDDYYYYLLADNYKTELTKREIIQAVDVIFTQMSTILDLLISMVVKIYTKSVDHKLDSWGLLLREKKQKSLDENLLKIFNFLFSYDGIINKIKDYRNFVIHDGTLNLESERYYHKGLPFNKYYVDELEKKGKKYRKSKTHKREIMIFLRSCIRPVFDCLNQTIEDLTSYLEDGR